MKKGTVLCPFSHSFFCTRCLSTNLLYHHDYMISIILDCMIASIHLYTLSSSRCSCTLPSLISTRYSLRISDNFSKPDISCPDSVSATYRAAASFGAFCMIIVFMISLSKSFLLVQYGIPC